MIKELNFWNGQQFERAKEMLDDARQNLNNNQYSTSLNRSYYAVFHAIRAV